MIRFVRGHLVAADADGVVVGMGGMGFGVRISDSTRADLPGIGSEVVLWGHSARGTTLAADEVARAAGTIAYELLCAVAQRVPFAPLGD